MFAAKKAGLTPVPYSENVSMVRRGNLAFLFNFGEEQETFATAIQGKNLIGTALQNGKITLAPQDMALIELL